MLEPFLVQFLDLLWWFVCNRPLKADDFDFSQLLLTQHSIIEKLELVHYNGDEIYEHLLCEDLENKTHPIVAMKDLLAVHKA